MAIPLFAEATEMTCCWSIFFAWFETATAKLKRSRILSFVLEIRLHEFSCKVHVISLTIFFFQLPKLSHIQGKWSQVSRQLKPGSYGWIRYPFPLHWWKHHVGDIFPPFKNSWVAAEVGVIKRLRWNCLSIGRVTVTVAYSWLRSSWL